MWIIASHPWHWIRKVLKILVEKSFLACTYLFAFHRLEFLFYLFISFIQIVITWRWFLSIFLFHLDSFIVSVLNKALINFGWSSSFTICFLIERIFKIIMWRFRKLFHNFEMIIHVKSSFSFVSIIWFTFALLFILSFRHLLNRINIFTNWLILNNVPRNIFMFLIFIHDIRT
mgnify:CR=1 FL=1